MALTGAQVKQLRSMAHHLNPAIIIGKSDVNEGTVEQTVAYLEKHELVKCSVLDGSSLSAREAAEELAERCHADVVQVIGRKFSLYRESSRKDIEKIKLVEEPMIRRANTWQAYGRPSTSGARFLSLDQHAIEPPLHQALV